MGNELVDLHFALAQQRECGARIVRDRAGLMDCTGLVSDVEERELPFPTAAQRNVANVDRFENVFRRNRWIGDPGRSYQRYFATKLCQSNRGDRAFRRATGFQHEAMDRLDRTGLARVQRPGDPAALGKLTSLRNQIDAGRVQSSVLQKLGSEISD